MHKKGCRSTTFFYFCLINLKKLNRFNYLYYIFIILIVFSCKKKEDNGKAPTIPPASSFLMDFSKLSDTIPTDTIDTTSVNYNYAVQKLNLWNSLINNTLGVPLHALLESYNHSPQYLSDGWWSWKSKMNYNQRNYNVDLRGKTTDDKNYWEAYIDMENGFDSFKWFEGECDYYSNVGIWYVKDNLYNNQNILQIDWTNDYYGSADIKYTKISETDSLKGSYIHYFRTLVNGYNSHYKISETIPNNYTEIRLNRSSNEGQIKDSLFFPDYNYHCWDSLKLELNCY